MELVSREVPLSMATPSMFPGFRFCPTDEELISYYLRKKLDGHEESVQVISEVEICKYEPWDLPAMSFIQSDNEWFFFSPRGRKYPNGSQSKRATECGYWKATGKERNVKSGSNVIGTKRTLVFHLGRAPKGERTEWIMHEYCINDKSQDSLVVCRLKRNTEFRLSDASNRASSSQIQPVHSHESSDGGIDQSQRGLGEGAQDKEVGCSSKRSSSSYGSEQIESVSESNQRPANDGHLTESSGHLKEVDEEDCYAEILKNDIIKLDESSISKAGHTIPEDPAQLDNYQGTAQRRIRLRVKRPRRSAEGARCSSKMHSSKSSFFARITTRLVVVFAFLVFTLVGVCFWSSFGTWSRTSEI
ncbi:NAC domain-containing protein 40 isoform X2 [Lotus japonicus]|uniref:NAC domain-containing protein 40 isoform X2 n=1 Tax=Lotus japonicus TaxID=34305 RepID=UPI00258A11AB|nr:NAC domain-containing protein 40 isoform X2 [Lotus japonicus]